MTPPLQAQTGIPPATTFVTVDREFSPEFRGTRREGARRRAEMWRRPGAPWRPHGSPTGGTSLMKLWSPILSRGWEGCVFFFLRGGGGNTRTDTPSWDRTQKVGRGGGAERDRERARLDPPLPISRTYCNLGFLSPPPVNPLANGPGRGRSRGPSTAPPRPLPTFNRGPWGLPPPPSVQGPTWLGGTPGGGRRGGGRGGTGGGGLREAAAASAELLARRSPSLSRAPSLSPSLPPFFACRRRYYAAPSPGRGARGGLSGRQRERGWRGRDETTPTPN